MRALIYQRAGIHLHPGKQAMVYSRLSRRLRETGHPSFGVYLQWLDGHAATDPEWQAFLVKAATMLVTMENKILSPAPFIARPG